MLYLTTIEIITSLFLAVGAFFTFLSAVGVIRLRDVYSRVHAAGKSSTFGMIFLMLSTFVYFIPKGIFNIKILLAILFVFMTAPLGALLINRSAYRSGVAMEKNTVQDDLKEVYKDELQESSE
ncbi:monovalent cation/H(+) antiporter subunit G [Oceanobacillus indicireducens]|uniref:monovalent cation/H(+) antiporter subunit G n=1 Tax=Oceanobacillus indicireducens TaxID=1004261 RepID=UPI0027E4B631|nr:monovalent cation/H(+) antiporter subunit G [Oceanobacillus indicireducens]